MKRLIEQAAKINVALTDKQIEQFQIYYEMLVETNKVMNLTAITELDEVITKHFVDSLALAEVYPEIKCLNQDVLEKEKYLKENDTTSDLRYSMKVLDLGTGAGFPGLPLKIAFPHFKITLMDSLNKRVKFLQSVIDKLELCDIEAVHGRAEEAARNKNYREQFDLCVSRAVANLSTLNEYCLPFVKVGGKFISYKAAEVEKEADEAKKAIQVLGGRLESIKKITLPDTDIERSFVMIEKKKNTPKTYPRKAGTASKEPIK